MTTALYPTERAVLRIYATVEAAMDAAEVEDRLRAGATPRLATGVADAVKTLDALGYIEAMTWADNKPERYVATSFGRLAHEAIA